jgi:hypothetical protein
VSNLLEDLDPAFRPVVSLILADAGEQIRDEFPGSTIRPAVTFRSLSEQAEARRIGASKLSVGMHNFGRALDVAVIDEKGDYVTDGKDRRYTIFGLWAKAHGAVWGGDWTHQEPDFDHCEQEMNGNAAELAAWLDGHKVA